MFIQKYRKSGARHLMSEKYGARHRKSGARHLMSGASTNSLRDCRLKQAYNTESIETEQYHLWTSTNISKYGELWGRIFGTQLFGTTNWFVFIKIVGTHHSSTCTLRRVDVNS